MSRKVAGIRDVPCMHMKITRGVHEYFSHLVSHISLFRTPAIFAEFPRDFLKLP